jgi:uncharacterized membrane protein YdjX (TVP38/TMEM64 family)
VVKFRVRWLVPAAGAVVVVVALALFGRSLAGAVPRFAAAVAGLGAWGAPAFVVGYALAAVAFVPGSLLTLAAGALFGLVRGSIYAFAGATLGATLAFLVSRHLARGLVERRVRANRRFAAIDAAVAAEGRKIVFLLRLSPVLPYTVLNYALGVTRVRLADFVLASAGMAPGTVLYVYYGKVAGDVAGAVGGAPRAHGAGYYATLATGLAATIAVTVVVTRVARRALQETAPDELTADV